MFRTHWYTLWIVAIIIVVLVIAVLLLVFQLGIIDWVLWLVDFER